MSKKAIIIRSIIAGILTLASLFLIYVNVDVAYNILYVENGGWSVIASVLFFAYFSPLVLITFIYQLILLIKKKFFIYDFVASILFILSWASLLIVPKIIDLIA